jgi:hypothetical protein
MGGHRQMPCHTCEFKDWDVSICIYCAREGALREFLDGADV